MDMGLGNTLLPGDPRLIDHIVGEVKSQGIFDQFRKDALADVDTKPAYQNLRTRVEASVNSFLSKQTWKADLNKNQLRETLRKQISDATYLDAGVERIVDQVVNPKIYSVFMPQIEDVVYKYLGLEKPKREKNGSCGLKDLLPIDLDPVSPESDKNSLKDVSLDSVDANLVMSDDKNKEIEMEIEEKSINNIKKNGDINDENINNDHVEEVEKLEEIDKPIRVSSTPPLPLLPPQQLEQNLLNDTAKPDEKVEEHVEEEMEEEEEEEEEDSPVFEPIDIMNLHESHISNDSHLSGISELTSHRSRSPDFVNEFSRDNFDFSNQDSQFSKVSSDSRLSIVTDFGSSNQASTPISDITKEDSNKEKVVLKDNFKAIRDESDKNKETKVLIDSNKVKENSLIDLKLSNNINSESSKNNLSSKESSRDELVDSKDKNEQKDKEKNREVSKSKSSKERTDSKDSRSHRDRDRDYKKKSSSNDNKNDNLERSKVKDKLESTRDTIEKIKENKDLNLSKSKDEKIKESTSSKESKDLKDIYKEKIRELREKKELTEKEKFNKENKESTKSSKDSNYKKDSSRDKKEYRNSSSSSSRNHSSKSENKSKSSSKDDKNSSRSSSKDKSRRDDKRRDTKDGRNKSQTESSDKSESRRSSKSEKDEKSSQRSSSSKKESRSDSHSRSIEKSESKRETESKDKKRRDDKKSKSKDDHPSLRKNSNDRRSSDRDGSNGSNGKGSTEKSNSSPSMSSSTPATSTLGKDSNNPSSNSSSEASDGIEEPLTEGCPISHNDVIIENLNVTNSLVESHHYTNIDVNIVKKIDCGLNEISLPLKKRPLNNDDDIALASSSSSPSNNEVVIKKPKFARNFHEAKKLMKLRKKLEKQKFLAQYDLEKKIQSQDESDETSSSSLPKKDDVEMVPDDERVQIIEVRVNSDDEPYPDDDIENIMTSEQRTKIILDGDQLLKPEMIVTKSNLSEMELSIRESLNEMMTDDNLKEASKSDRDIEKSQRNTSDISTSEKGEKIMANKIVTTFHKDIQHSIQYSKSTKKYESSDSEEDCLYFVQDNERLMKFTKFLESFGIDEYSSTDEDNVMIVDELKSVELQTMAPPQSKRRYSTSPLFDIILNNSNNNNDCLEMISESTTTTTSAAGTTTIYDDETPTKKKKLGRPKKQRPSVSSSSPQNVTNGDHFVMPLSPDSDVSATSEKMPLQLTRDDKSRPRNNQRYTSDDLYKPRPMFVSSSRRNRRSNQS